MIVVIVPVSDGEGSVARMGSWGSELWDQSDSLFREVARSTKELDTWYGTFFKERSKVEADYAKSLRKLIKNFSPKDKTKSQEDETSQQKGFRLEGCEAEVAVVGCVVYICEFLSLQAYSADCCW